MPQLKSKRELDPGRERAGADTCGHANPTLLRLIEYTRYGTWIGCLECGTSWLTRADMGVGRWTYRTVITESSVESPGPRPPTR